MRTKEIKKAGITKYLTLVNFLLAIVAIIATIATAEWFIYDNKISNLKATYNSQLSNLEATHDARLKAIESAQELELIRHAAADMKSNFTSLASSALGITDAYAHIPIDSMTCERAAPCASYVRTWRKLDDYLARFTTGGIGPQSDDIKFCYLAAKILILESMKRNNFDEEDTTLILQWVEDHSKIAGQNNLHKRYNSLLHAFYRKEKAKLMLRAAMRLRADNKEVAKDQAISEYGSAIGLYEAAIKTNDSCPESSKNQKQFRTAAFSGICAILEDEYVFTGSEDFLTELTTRLKQQNSNLSRNSIPTSIDSFIPLFDFINYAECLIWSEDYDSARTVLDATDPWCKGNMTSLEEMDFSRKQRRVFNSIQALKIYVGILSAIKKKEMVGYGKLDELTDGIRRFGLDTCVYAAHILNLAQNALDAYSYESQGKAEMARLLMASTINEIGLKQQGWFESTYNHPKILLRQLCDWIKNRELF